LYRHFDSAAQYNCCLGGLQVKKKKKKKKKKKNKQKKKKGGGGGEATLCIQNQSCLTIQRPSQVYHTYRAVVAF
jgi:hypothetical protein